MKLERQIYGLAMAQGSFGGPQGVWLECQSCSESQKIVGAPVTMSNAAAARVFRSHGWTGRGDRMLRAKCPKCNA